MHHFLGGMDVRGYMVTHWKMRNAKIKMMNAKKDLDSVFVSVMERRRRLTSCPRILDVANCLRQSHQ